MKEQPPSQPPAPAKLLELAESLRTAASDAAKLAHTHHRVEQADKGKA